MSIVTVCPFRISPEEYHVHPLFRVNPEISRFVVPKVAHQILGQRFRLFFGKSPGFRLLVYACEKTYDELHLKPCISVEFASQLSLLFRDMPIVQGDDDVRHDDYERSPHDKRS